MPKALRSTNPWSLATKRKRASRNPRNRSDSEDLKHTFSSGLTCRIAVIAVNGVVLLALVDGLVELGKIIVHALWKPVCIPNLRC